MAIENFRVFNPNLLAQVPYMTSPSVEFITTARLVLSYVYNDRYLGCQWQDIVNACCQPEQLNEDLLNKLSQLSDVYLIDAMIQANPLERYAALQNDPIEAEFFQVICSILDVETRIFNEQFKLRQLADRLHHQKDHYGHFTAGLKQSVEYMSKQQRGYVTASIRNQPKPIYAQRRQRSQSQNKIHVKKPSMTQSKDLTSNNLSVVDSVETRLAKLPIEKRIELKRLRAEVEKYAAAMSKNHE